MAVVKSFSVGNGDMFYISHGSDNFTIIDCCIDKYTSEEILDDITKVSASKGIRRFISTHPDEDHFGGIELLDNASPISNFYVIKNKAIKSVNTPSFKKYCELRDGSKAFKIYKGCTRKWMNLGDDTRGSSGVSILWPDVNNESFLGALKDAETGVAYNNMSAVVRYNINGGASFLWLGDLDTDFMSAIEDDIELTKTTVVFAAHHGRRSGKIPNSWLERLDPQIIVIGEAPSRHLNYYTGYNTLTQNTAGDITMDCLGNRVHFYVSDKSYSSSALTNEWQSAYPNYIGSITVETEYTL